MKNFPHQYSDLVKLRATLQTEQDLQDRGLDSTDDAVLGYELAHRRVYRFRGLDYDGDGETVDRRVAERIETERTKPPGTQGARTAAREMRRTLLFLGWLDANGAGLTAAGSALLRTREGSGEERILLQQAIGSIAVADRDGRVSHPVQVLLRLVEAVPLDSRNGMEVALEAVDDSVGEFQRVAAIAAMPEQQRIAALKDAGWTDPQLANAVKILPALAIQAELMAIGGDGRFVLTEAGRRTIGRAVITTGLAQPAARQRTQGPAARAATMTATRDPRQVGRSHQLSGEDLRVLTAAEQAAAAALVYERTERHQALVRAVAARCGSAGFFEDLAAFDLLVDLDSGGPLVLIEVKTVVGDAVAQVRAAVGQLLYYEYFSVGPAFPGRDVHKLVVADAAIPQELGGFLEQTGIGLVTWGRGTFSAGNPRGSAIASSLFTG